MAIVFPSGLDNFTNPTPANNLNTPAVLHTDQHSDLNDAVEALEAKVGTDGSLVTGSFDYRISYVSSVASGLVSGTHSPVTLGIANGLSLSGQILSMGLASATATGTLSAADWVIFNSKQSALSFPLVTSLGGTGINNSGTFTNQSNSVITGGGTIALGGFTLTVPATGTAALLATANVFTAIQKINVNSTTALLVEQDGVKDNTFIVDTTNGRIGVAKVPASLFEALSVSANAQFRFFADSDVQGHLPSVDFVKRTAAGGGPSPLSGNVGAIQFYAMTTGGAERLVGQILSTTASLDDRYDFQLRKWNTTAAAIQTFMYVDNDNNLNFGTSSLSSAKVSVTGVSDQVQFDVLGFTTQGSTVARFRRNDGSTSSINVVLIVGANSTSTPGAGFGARQLFRLESSTTADQDAAGIDVSWVTATHASRKAKMSLSAYDTAARLGIEIEADGSVAKLGFYGATTIVKPSSTTDLRVALINLGLYTTGGATPLDLNGGALKVGAITNDTGLAHGTYTPTRSAEANMDANVTMTEAQYMRVGNTVTVSGRFTADPTLPATTTSFEITLPVASNIGAVEDLAGVAFCGNIAAQGAEATGSVANNTAVITWKSSDTTSQSWSYIFTYQVI